ncbi:MAG: PIG-L deacetylase family protein, partial [Streptosporangiaceae bacterium]
MTGTAPAASAPASPIDAPGTAEAAWSRWPMLGRVPTLDVTGWASVVIVAAHPDDEVLGPGGIIATLAAAGASVRVVAVTDGEASHGHRADPAALTRRRVTERQAALHA